MRRISQRQSPGAAIWTMICAVALVTTALVAALITTPAMPPQPLAPRANPIPFAVADPSGEPMPVGDLPGWKQIFTEDFTDGVTQGNFPGPYASKWLSYTGFHDTSQKGWYDQAIISAENGALDLYLHTGSGKPLGAAPVPLVGGVWGGQLYGRFTVRMKADPLPGFGIGFLLWTDSDTWADGEVDFPEGDLAATAQGHNHCLGDPYKTCLNVDSHTAFSSWHTYTIEWTSKKLSFLLDGTVIATTTDNVPHTPMHWVMQVGTDGTTPAPSIRGHLLIDWAVIYRYVP